MRAILLFVILFGILNTLEWRFVSARAEYGFPLFFKVSILNGESHFNIVNGVANFAFLILAVFSLFTAIFKLYSLVKIINSGAIVLAVILFLTLSTVEREEVWINMGSRVSYVYCKHTGFPYPSSISETKMPFAAIDSPPPRKFDVFISSSINEHFSRVDSIDTLLHFVDWSVVEKQAPPKLNFPGLAMNFLFSLLSSYIICIIMFYIYTLQEPKNKAANVESRSDPTQQQR